VESDSIFSCFPTMPPLTGLEKWMGGFYKDDAPTALHPTSGMDVTTCGKSATDDLETWNP
jgi:hypothetical protein